MSSYLKLFEKFRTNLNHDLDALFEGAVLMEDTLTGIEQDADRVLVEASQPELYTYSMVYTWWQSADFAVVVAESPVHAQAELYDYLCQQNSGHYTNAQIEAFVRDATIELLDTKTKGVATVIDGE